MTNQSNPSNSNQEHQINRSMAMNLEAIRKSGLLDYRSEAMPTWCPGCGYYGITSSITHALNELKIDTKDFVVVSGIGCAGRYPFFVNGYGFHGIHGRTLPIACGVKMSQPKLKVLAVAGDGDAFAIGGGHLPHAIRRNPDLTYVVFDNNIYGLTKGQSSPTTPQNQITKTTPYGNPDAPINPILIGLAYGASFLGVGYAGLPDSLTELFIKAFSHKGFSLVIVTTPCITFDHLNITYDRLRDLWKPIPSGHDTADLQAAMQLAINGSFLYGIYYQKERPSFEDLQSAIRQKAQKKAQ
jgi:2-oxoglutarate/2-oxoacid ferredoxin oxidoreductase subunit beta